MTVAEYLAYFIEKKGIKNVFQLSGGMITQLIDKIDERAIAIWYMDDGSILKKKLTSFLLYKPLLPNKI